MTQASIGRQYDLQTFLPCFLQNKFNTRKEHIEDEMKKEANNVKKEVEEDFGTGKFAKYQRILWDLIEKPHTSTPAKVSKQYQKHLLDNRSWSSFYAIFLNASTSAVIKREWISCALLFVF